MGSLELIGGNMWSGKTTALLRILSIDTSINRQVLYINHSFDTRTLEPFSTHNPLFKDNLNISNMTLLKTPKLPPIADISAYDTIGVDEAQFFDNLEEVQEYVEKGNKRVVVAGLTSDTKRQKFGRLLDLIPLADSYQQLTAFCSVCGNQKLVVPAPFTCRLTDSQAQIDIGGADKYVSVCRKHYLQLR